MTKDNSYTPSCVDCGTQNCKFKDRTYPEFCLTTGLDTKDLEKEHMNLKEQLKQLHGAKNKLATQMDHLSVSDKH